MSHASTKAILTVSALLLAACASAVSVNSDWSPSADFSAFETFAWLPPAQDDGAGPASDPIMDERIRMSIESELVDRGMQKVSEGADLMVGYQITTRTNVSYRTTGTTWGRAGWGGWGGGVTTMRTTPVYSQAGTLLIRFYETHDKSLVWHGSGQTDMRHISDTRERQQRIDELVRRTLREFPPPQ
jgi:hypothetical protein